MVGEQRSGDDRVLRRLGDGLNSVLRWHFAKAGRLTIKQLLSPRFIWMAAMETDEFRHQADDLHQAVSSFKAALDIREAMLRKDTDIAVRDRQIVSRQG